MAPIPRAVASGGAPDGSSRHYPNPQAILDRGRMSQFTLEGAGLQEEFVSMDKSVSERDPVLLAALLSAYAVIGGVLFLAVWTVGVTP